MNGCDWRQGPRDPRLERYVFWTVDLLGIDNFRKCCRIGFYKILEKVFDFLAF